MMTTKPGIYTPLGMDGYELCHPVSQGDFERINALINGDHRQDSWDPIQVSTIREDEGRDLIPSDSPWLGSHALIFNSRADGALGPLLRRYGEMLPVSCLEADLWIYNPTNVIDALNEATSSVLRFADNRIMMIERYAFSPDVVADNDVFKIPSLRVSPTFVSHRFVDLWKASRLTGLEFKRVWAAGDA